MSLRDRLRGAGDSGSGDAVFDRFGIVANPFPASNQTSGNPHFPGEADEEAEERIIAFFREGASRVVVIEGTQGVGKTNFLNHFESEIREALRDRKLRGRKGYYIVRYHPDPEASFEGTTRRLFEELGKDHLSQLAGSLGADDAPIEQARGYDMREALRRLRDDAGLAKIMMEWLLGHRLLKVHREKLGVQFRLDTVESKTAALRDMVQVSASAGVLNGIFLLLDELEKQDGVLGPRAVVRYLSALRAVVDALPRGLFMMIAITPDALIRYSGLLPALRGRLEHRIELKTLGSRHAALRLAEFYMETARRKAVVQLGRPTPDRVTKVVNDADVENRYLALRQTTSQRADKGVRQREFLHDLHMLAEEAIQDVSMRG